MGLGQGLHCQGSAVAGHHLRAQHAVRTHSLRLEDSTKTRRGTDCKATVSTTTCHPHLLCEREILVPKRNQTISQSVSSVIWVQKVFRHGKGHEAGSGRRSTGGCIFAVVARHISRRDGPATRSLECIQLLSTASVSDFNLDEAASWSQGGSIIKCET